MNSKVTENTKCYHCGEVCEEEITLASKSFCCQGCKTVYEIISENGLATYYSLNQSPGIQRKTTRKFDYLDNAEIASRFTQFRNDTVTRVKLKLPEIHCTSCIWLLENLHKIHPGVLRSQVNFSKKESSILFDHARVSLKELAELLTSIGYTPDFSAGDDQAANKKPDFLIRKIAVAGFCFGNSMLISLPHYLDSSSQLEDFFSNYFGMINIILAIPVVVFSASGYFKSSLLGLRKKHISMDLPIALGIITLFARSLYEIISTTGAGYIDSLCGLVFFLLIGQWFQSKTYRSLSFDRDYKSFFPIAVNKVLKSGQCEIVPLEKLKKGDLIEIHNDEIIPADGLITSGRGNIDYSFVTGESQPEKKVINDIVFAGGRQKGETLRIQISQLVSAGHLTTLWNQQSNKTNKAQLEQLTDKIAPYFVAGILLLALISGISWFFIDPSQVWLVITSVLIVACPCALALAAPFGLGQAMRILGSKDLYLRNVHVVELLSKVKNIIFDKTGTLTHSRKSVVRFKGKLSEDQRHLFRALTDQSLHPISRSINSFLNKSAKAATVRNFREMPGLGIEGQVNGHSLRLGSERWLRQNSEIGTHVEIDGNHLGYFIITPAFRNNIFELLGRLKNKFKTYVLSGDNDSERAVLAPAVHQVFFRQKPEDKLRHVQMIKSEGNTLMIGDGLNDAGALNQADVGIAIAEDLHQFSPSSDAIMSAHRLDSLDGFIEFSRKSINVIYAAFALSLAYNVVGLSFAVSGYLTPLLSAILMPLSSITVVIFVTSFVTFLGRKYG